MSLIDATISTKKEEVERLLRSGADINQKDSYGDTAMMYAAYKGHIEIAELLARSNADVNVKNNVRTYRYYIYCMYIP